MSTYQKISDLTAGSALGGTEQFEAVQSSASVYITPAQIATYAGTALATTFAAYNAATVTATSIITGEYIFDEDSELDYSSSLTNGMAAATVTFSELPSSTVAVWVYYSLSDTSSTIRLAMKRTSGGTAVEEFTAVFADAGLNTIRGTSWIATGGNSIYVTNCTADTTRTFKILGYKTA